MKKNVAFLLTALLGSTFTAPTLCAMMEGDDKEGNKSIPASATASSQQEPATAPSSFEEQRRLMEKQHDAQMEAMKKQHEENMKKMRDEFDKISTEKEQTPLQAAGTVASKVADKIGATSDRNVFKQLANVAQSDDPQRSLASIIGRSTMNGERLFSDEAAQGLAGAAEKAVNDCKVS